MACRHRPGHSSDARYRGSDRSGDGCRDLVPADRDFIRRRRFVTHVASRRSRTGRSYVTGNGRGDGKCRASPRRSRGPNRVARAGRSSRSPVRCQAGTMVFTSAVTSSHPSRTGLRWPSSTNASLSERSVCAGSPHPRQRCPLPRAARPSRPGRSSGDGRSARRPGTLRPVPPGRPPGARTRHLEIKSLLLYQMS